MPSEVTLVNEYVNRTVNKLTQRSLGCRLTVKKDCNAIIINLNVWISHKILCELGNYEMLNKVHNSTPFGQIPSNANNRWYVEFRNGQGTNLTHAVSFM
jgi:hypothetical protein